jgi:hypothetical protein
MPYTAGRFLFEWLDDGRNMRLECSLVFYSKKYDLEILIPRGEVTDGASIPQFLWSLEGGPFSGKYRKAAIVHDYLCRTKFLTWKQTHKIFFEAMLDEGVNWFEAIKKYRAVYRFGPRWPNP